MWPEDEMGCYYSETINSDALGICLFKVWEQGFFTTSMILFMSYA